MSRRDEAYLEHILSACEAIVSYVKGMDREWLKMRLPDESRLSVRLQENSVMRFAKRAQRFRGQVSSECVTSSSMSISVSTLMKYG